MGCCFSKELNPSLLSERTSLLQPSVTVSFADQEVKNYSAVSKLTVENCHEYGQNSREVDIRNDTSASDPSAGLRSVDKRSSSIKDGMEVWDELKIGSHNKPLGDVPKDSDIQASTETAVLKSVKRSIAENAVKRANWFCDIDLSHADSAPLKPRSEKTTATDTLMPNGCRVRPTYTSDAISSKLCLTQEQNQEHGHTKSNINQNSDGLFTAKHLSDDPLDSDKKRSDFVTSNYNVKRRTQSFYSICSIDADDLEIECDAPAVMLPATFDHTDLLTNNKPKFFISTSLGNEDLQTLNKTTETHDLSTETLKTAYMFPDIFCTFLKVGSDGNAAPEQPVSVPTEFSVTDKSEMCGHRLCITGLLKNGHETIPDLLEGKNQLCESKLDQMDANSLCQTLVNTEAEIANVSKLELSELGSEIDQSETLEQETKSVYYQENQINSCLDCRECKQPELSTEVILSVKSGTWHEPAPCSHVEPDDPVQGFLCSEISSVSQITEDHPSSFLTSVESEIDVNRVFIPESSSQDVDMLHLNSNSCLSPGEMSIEKPSESICSHAEREATHLEARSELNSPQSSNSSTSYTSQPQAFQAGLVDFPRFNACLLLTHHDAEKKEMSLGTEVIICHISSTKLSDVKPESEIADEHVEISENSVLVNSSLYDEPLEANWSLGKSFSENSTSLTSIEREVSQLPFVLSPDADFSSNINILEDALQNHEELKFRTKHTLPAVDQENFNMKEDGCCQGENEMLLKAEYFNEYTLKVLNQISSSAGHVEAPVMELQNSKAIDFDLSIGRNKDEQVIHLFLEGSSENTVPSLHSSPHTKLPYNFETASLSKNSSQSKSAHIPKHTLLGKPEMQSSSDLSNQEPELTPVDVQDEQMISTAEQQVDVDYKVPLGRIVSPLFEIGEPPHALEGHHNSDEGVECFLVSRLQGYQLADESYASESTHDQGTSGMCSAPIFYADNKAIPLPVEPDQVDLYASMPSYEIHFLGPNTLTIPQQVENPQTLPPTNETERVLNMVSELLGKSEVSEDVDCSPFLSVWEAEPELESAWQYCLSEKEMKGRNTQEDGAADLAVDYNRVPAFTMAYPYSLLGSDESCMWDWQTAYDQLVRLHPCCVA